MEFVATYEQNAEKPPEEWIKTGFSLEIPMTTWDHLIPKHCAKCKKLFFRGGRKSVHGDMRHTKLTVEYVCDTC
jgi:hypothetical protein